MDHFTFIKLVLLYVLEACTNPAAAVFNTGCLFFSIMDKKNISKAAQKTDHVGCVANQHHAAAGV